MGHPKHHKKMIIFLTLINVLSPGAPQAPKISGDRSPKIDHQMPEICFLLHILFSIFTSVGGNFPHCPHTYRDPVRQTPFRFIEKSSAKFYIFVCSAAFNIGSPGHTQANTIFYAFSSVVQLH